jgi:Ser/Thr protein kinase RdoA (MazF antagonist)
MIPAEETAARKTLEGIDQDLSRLPVSRDNFGLIHFDFELDNLLWQEDRPGIIDFDSCTCSWFAADIAFALRDLFADRADRVDPGDQRFLTFLDGYRQARELSPEEIDWIPLFLQMHNLVTFAGLYRSMEAGPCPDDPTWLVHLREKLTRKQAAYRDGFCQYTKRING